MKEIYYCTLRRDFGPEADHSVYNFNYWGEGGGLSHKSNDGMLRYTVGRLSIPYLSVVSVRSKILK